MKMKLTCFHILILIGLVAFAIYWSGSISKSQKILLNSHQQLMQQPSSLTQPIKIDKRHDDSYEREW